MRFNSMLVSTFFFASVALAGRSQFHRQSLVRKSVNASSDPATEISDWVGALYGLDSGSFDHISGTVVMPNISGPINSGIIVELGIDGYVCTPHLAAGVDVTVTPNGTSYQAWGQFGDDDDEPDIAISAGDRIQFTVDALNKTSGLVVIKNLRNGQNHRWKHRHSDPLCGLNAGWVVSLQWNANDTAFLPLPKFNVTFTDAVASGKSGHHYLPRGANITKIQYENGTVVPTSVTFGECSVTIKHV